MIGSLNVAEDRLIGLLDRMGPDIVFQAQEQLIQYAEKFMRAEINDIPDGNYEYFEKDFDYDEILKLPQKPSVPIDDPIDVDPVDEVTNYNADPLKFIEEITIGAEGMKKSLGSFG